MVRNAVSLFITGGWNDFMFRNEKFLGFAHPYSLLEYFQNNEIDSNKTLWKRQYTNGSIKEQQFLNRGSNKLYSSHLEKKEDASMGNTWVICAFALFYHGKWREGGLRLLHNLSLSCFINKVMTSRYYVVTNSSIIDDVGVRDPILVCLFLVQKLPKRLKFNKIDICMFKVKKKSTRTSSIICSKLTIKTPKRR